MMERNNIIRTVGGWQKTSKNVSNTISHLKFFNWNLNGHSSTSFGNKLEDPDFLEMVTGYDVVSLVETHSSSNDLNIPGFAKPWQITRKKTGSKSFGGIAVFCKRGPI